VKRYLKNVAIMRSGSSVGRSNWKAGNWYSTCSWQPRRKHENRKRVAVLDLRG